MDYRKLTADARKWNRIRIFLLLFNIFNLASSITAITVGIFLHLYIFMSASYLYNYGFSYNQYSPVLSIYGTILLLISCVGIAVACRRNSYRLTKLYTQLLSALTVVETVAVILAVPLYPFMERHIWNVMQYTIKKCEVTSVANYAIEYVQMVFKCCGLNHPDAMTNETEIETNCYANNKYTIHSYYCQPERYYRINCFDQIYSDLYDKLFIILIYLVVVIALQGLAIYCSVLHGLNIQKRRDTAIELAKTDDDVVISRYNRNYDF